MLSYTLPNARSACHPPWPADRVPFKNSEVFFMETILVCLSFALGGGLLMSRLAKRLGLPAVTAYLIGGLLMGPYCLGALGLPGLGLLMMLRWLG